MPKVKYLDRPGDGLTNFIRSRAYLACRGMAGLADTMGCGRPTLYRRIRQPENFTLAELRSIRQSTGASVDELMEQLRPLL